MKTIIKEINPIATISIEDIIKQNSLFPLIGMTTISNACGKQKWLLSSNGKNEVAFTNGDTFWTSSDSLKELLISVLQDELVKEVLLFDNLTELTEWLVFQKD